MKQIYVRLTAESPLAIRSDHAPGGAEVARYIPGTAFVGSLAAVHRMLYPTQKADFEQLFLSGQVVYPHLYPAVFQDKKELQWSNLPVYPIPKTAQSCKRHPGFLYPVDDENDAHGVRDSLIDWAIFKLNGPGNAKDALSALNEYKKCHYKKEYSCQAVMDHFSGYYRRSGFQENKKEITAANESEYMRLQTHTGIDRDSGTVQEGILYNRRVFEEGMQFWGAISVPDDEQLLEKLIAFLERVGHDGLVRIGTGRTRGMGSVTFDTVFVDDEPDSFEMFCERLHTLHGLLKEPAKKAGLQNRYFFALTLHSPLILVDNLLRYQGIIAAPMLEKQLGYDEKIELKLEYSAASMRRLTGWQELWGMPRLNEYAIDTGSVFLFSCNAAKGTPENEALLRKLFELDERGMGKRRIEGFGQVCVSDRFHQERDVL